MYTPGDRGQVWRQISAVMIFDLSRPSNLVFINLALINSTVPGMWYLVGCFCVILFFIFSKWIREVIFRICSLRKQQWYNKNIIWDWGKEISTFTKMSIKRTQNPLCKKNKEIALYGYVILVIRLSKIWVTRDGDSTGTQAWLAAHYDINT